MVAERSDNAQSRYACEEGNGLLIAVEADLEEEERNLDTLAEEWSNELRPTHHGRSGLLQGDWLSRIADLELDVGRREQRVLRLYHVRGVNQRLAKEASLELIKNKEYLDLAQSLERVWEARWMELNGQVHSVTDHLDQRRNQAFDLRQSLHDQQEKLLAMKREELNRSDAAFDKLHDISGELLSKQHDLLRRRHQELADAEELGLCGQRIDSLRDEFRGYRAKMEEEIKELLAMLVEAQKELGVLQGRTDERERLVKIAQDKLNALTPWVGIEVVAGPKQRVRVLKVRPRGPAEAAGIRKGDVIEQANGEVTNVNEEFRLMILKVKSGDVISFQVNRRREMLNLTIKVASKIMSFKNVTQLRRIAGGVIQAADYAFISRVESTDQQDRLLPGAPKAE